MKTKPDTEAATTYKIKLPPISNVNFGTLLIEVFCERQKLGTATGFIVHKDDRRWFLITNRHVVTGRHQHTQKCLDKYLRLPTRIIVMHHEDSASRKLTAREEFLYQDDGNFEVGRWVEHPHWGARADFVALELKNLGGTWTQSWDLQPNFPEQAIAPAMPVSVVGYPFGISYAENFPIWATGFIASEPSLDYAGLPVILVDCRARQGQSGSPVVKHNLGAATLMNNGSVKIGEHMTTFVGIYSGRINEESDIGMVWKRDAILELVDSL